jgi:hypothetical protein
MVDWQMKYVYMTIIALCTLFNSFANSYAFSAWESGIPLTIMLECGGNTDKALQQLTLSELMEVKTS